MEAVKMELIQKMSDMTFEAALPLLRSGKVLQKEGADYRVQYIEGPSHVTAIKIEKDGTVCSKELSFFAEDLRAKWNVCK